MGDNRILERSRGWVVPGRAHSCCAWDKRWWVDNHNKRDDVLPPGHRRHYCQDHMLREPEVPSRGDVLDRLHSISMKPGHAPKTFTGLGDRKSSKLHELVNGECTSAHELLVESRSGLSTESLSEVRLSNKSRQQERILL